MRSFDAFLREMIDENAYQWHLQGAGREHLRRGMATLSRSSACSHVHVRIAAELFMGE